MQEPSGFMQYRQSALTNWDTSHSPKVAYAYLWRPGQFPRKSLRGANGKSVLRQLSWSRAAGLGNPEVEPVFSTHPVRRAQSVVD